MVRRGWTQIDVPAGWTQVIRGRRPPSVQWLSARQEAQKRSQSAVSKQAPRQSSKVDPLTSKIMRIETALKALGPEQLEARTCLEEVLKKAKTEGSESRNASSRPPEASVAEANAKIVRLQSSLAALGPDDVAERRVLEDALAKVRARAIVAPIGQRLDECEKFFERAEKRVEKAREDFSGDESETTSRASVARGGSISCEFHSLWFHRDGVGASCQVRISVDVPVDRGGRQETPPSEWRNHTMKCKSRSGVVTVSRDAWCGLRAVRVGEASHPGPGRRIRRTQRLRALQRAMDRAEESDLETESLMSVDVAQEEHMVPSTVPASGVLRVEGPAEVIPMFDGSADGSEHEVDAAPVGRRRLVLVSQGSHVSQAGEGRLEDDRDDSIDGVC